MMVFLANVFNVVSYSLVALEDSQNQRPYKNCLLILFYRILLLIWFTNTTDNDPCHTARSIKVFLLKETCRYLLIVKESRFISD
jgi:hypothetical protein